MNDEQKCKLTSLYQDANALAGDERINFLRDSNILIDPPPQAVAGNGAVYIALSHADFDLTLAEFRLRLFGLTELEIEPMT